MGSLKFSGSYGPAYSDVYFTDENHDNIAMQISLFISPPTEYVNLSNWDIAMLTLIFGTNWSSG